MSYGVVGGLGGVGVQQPFGNPLPYMHRLSVDEIERLAKAGVAITLSTPIEVVEKPGPNTYPATAMQHGTPEHLLDLIRQRWRMAMEAKGDPHFGNFYQDPLLAAIKHGDKVHVFVGGGFEPQIIVDDACIYPSDALLAKLHLLVQNNGGGSEIPF